MDGTIDARGSKVNAELRMRNVELSFHSTFYSSLPKLEAALARS
jgi:hypothetical protein